jgi:hypothetical protein
MAYDNRYDDFIRLMGDFMDVLGFTTYQDGAGDFGERRYYREDRAFSIRIMDEPHSFCEYPEGVYLAYNDTHVEKWITSPYELCVWINNNENGSFYLNDPFPLNQEGEDLISQVLANREDYLLEAQLDRQEGHDLGVPLGEAAYPEHAKIMGRTEEHHHIQEFLGWMEMNGMYIYGPGESEDQVLRFEQVVADYFGVDLQAFHKEKDEILESWKEG